MEDSEVPKATRKDFVKMLGVDIIQRASTPSSADLKIVVYIAEEWRYMAFFLLGF
jgi:hypothetical protein